MNTAQLILSLGTILVAVRLFGWLFQRIGQPKVVGEMAAGILLGPGFVGHFFPTALAVTFPASSLTTLSALSQIGVVLFMFIVGLEVDLDGILKNSVTMVLTSNFSILVPFLLGTGLARLFYPQFAAEGISFSVFAMFIGTAMSITAFPVLARILRERNLLGTTLGQMAISCASIDDISAWLLLAVLTAMVHSSQNWNQFAMTLLKMALFVVFMLVPGRRAASYLKIVYRRDGVSPALFSTVIFMMLLSSWITEQLGIHALFGAFVAGLIIPKDRGLIAGLADKLEYLTLTLLLPIFFVLTGLRTRFDLIPVSELWSYTLIIIGVAVAGKFAGASVTAYASGMKWRDSVGLGILMNTRGLVELVVLNVGLELKILTVPLFTMMVMMALTTTFMATPLLSALRIPSDDRKMPEGSPAFSRETVEGAELDRAS